MLLNLLSLINAPYRAESEKRWTVFSTAWFALMELKYLSCPPALRFLWFIATRAVMFKVYEAHKALILWREWYNRQALLPACPQQLELVSSLQ